MPEGAARAVTPRMVVADVDGAVAFLREVFGAVGEVSPGRPAEIGLGDTTILVSEVGERDPFPVFLYVHVDDADVVFGRAISAGARSVEEPAEMPWGDRRAMVEDPFGNLFQVAHRA